MGRVIDITEKLQFDENPKMRIGGELVEVNADAETMLRIMGVFANKPQMTAIGEAIELLFSESELAKIYAIKDKNGNKLNAKSLMTIIQSAMNLVMGESEGEQ